MKTLAAKLVKRKALLAIAFAGAILNSDQPAISSKGTEWSSPILKSNLFKQSQPISPAEAAYDQLRLASGYLNDGNRTVLKTPFNSILNRPGSRTRFGHITTMDNVLVPWANEVALNAHADLKSSPISQEILVEADTAIKKAVLQLDKIYDPFVRLNLYFIASLLLQGTGNTADVEKCNTALENAIQSCEQNQENYESDVKAVSSILNSMAYGIIPVELPMFTPKEYPAEKEKQTLFKLVGIEDDRILYPLEAGCGHIVWWQTPNEVLSGNCGMG